MLAQLRERDVGRVASKIPHSCLTCIAKAKYALLSRYGSERPWTVRPPSSSTMRSNSCVSRVLPIPAGPITVTRCGTRSAETCSQTPCSRSSSRARPTRSPECDRSPAARFGRTASQASTGSDLPFARTASSGSYSIASLVAACVSAPTITPFTGAADCRREAVLTTSPATSDSPSAEPRTERDERLAGVHGDPQLQVEVQLARVELLCAVAHRQRPAHRALGVVAVGRRRAEDRHDRVADELLDGSPERLQLPAARARGRARAPPAPPRGRASRRGR